MSSGESQVTRAEFSTPTPLRLHIFRDKPWWIRRWRRLRPQSRRKKKRHNSALRSILCGSGPKSERGASEGRKERKTELNEFAPWGSIKFILIFSILKTDGKRQKERRIKKLRKDRKRINCAEYRKKGEEAQSKDLRGHDPGGATSSYCSCEINLQSEFRTVSWTFKKTTHNRILKIYVYIFSCFSSKFHF